MKLINYEWFHEETDYCGEILNTNHYKTLSELLLSHKDDLQIGSVGLLCNYLENFNGDIRNEHREYLYFEGNRELPSYFDDGRKVPKKYLNESKEFKLLNGE